MTKYPYPELPRRGAYPDLVSLRRDWDVSQETFDKFLTWLSPNHDEVGNRFEQIRGGLIRIFRCRGCDCAEDLADETILRVTIKAENLADTYVDRPEPYFYGVARKVHLEYTRTQRPALPLPAPDPPERKELELQCLEQCMEGLPKINRELILEYYREEKRAKINLRKQLAEKLGIECNALRLRVHRIRTELRACVLKCLLEAEKY